MFKESRYQTQIQNLTDQDKKLSFEDSTIPTWSVVVNTFKAKLVKQELMFYSLRHDSKPQAGKSKGLVLVLDAHSDLVTASSVPNDFQVFTVICDDIIH